MRKSEIYANTIGIHKRGGQGLSGIVGKMNKEIQEILDELVEEGHLKVNVDSYEHLPNDNWYSPVKGYTVWDDPDKRALSFVRMFLGLTEEIFLNLPYTDFIQNPVFMSSYSEWLIKNKEQLDIMLNLDEEYKGEDILFNEEEIEYIKSREWYTNNETITKCLELSKGTVSDFNKKIEVTKELISLYKRSGGYETEILAAIDDNDKSEKGIKLRKRLHNYLETFEKNKLIQEVEF